MAFSYTLMLFPSGQESLSSVANPGASPLSSLAPAHLPWATSRIPGSELMETQPRPQSHPAEHKAQQLLGESRGTFSLHEAVAGHLPPRASVAFPILRHSLAPRLGTAGSSWQQLARTGDAVDGWQWVTPGAAQVRSRPAGLWVFLILRYLQTRA